MLTIASDIISYALHPARKAEFAVGEIKFFDICIKISVGHGPEWRISGSRLKHSAVLNEFSPSMVNQQNSHLSETDVKTGDAGVEARVVENPVADSVVTCAPDNDGFVSAGAEENALFSSIKDEKDEFSSLVEESSESVASMPVNSVSADCSSTGAEQDSVEAGDIDISSLLFGASFL